MFGLNLSTVPGVSAKYQPYVPYALPVISGLLGVMVIGFLLVPNISGILDQKTLVDADGVKAQLLKDKIKFLQDLDQTKLTGELAKTEAALPTDKDAARFLATITEIASTSGSTVDNAQLNTTGSTRGSEKNSLDFSVIIRGNYANVKGFLTNIETTRTVMAVKSITINIGDGARLSADLAITGYYEPISTTPVSADAALPERTSAHDQVLAELDRRTIYIPPAPTPSVSGRSDPFSGI